MQLKKKKYINKAICDGFLYHRQLNGDRCFLFLIDSDLALRLENDLHRKENRAWQLPALRINYVIYTGAILTFGFRADSQQVSLSSRGVRPGVILSAFNTRVLFTLKRSASLPITQAIRVLVQLSVWL